MNSTNGEEKEEKQILLSNAKNEVKKNNQANNLFIHSIDIQIYHAFAHNQPVRKNGFERFS